MENEIREVAPKAKSKRVGIVTAYLLNFRKEPNFESEVIKVLNEGSKVKILTYKSSSFYKVLVDGVEGYCAKEFVEVENYE